MFATHSPNSTPSMNAFLHFPHCFWPPQNHYLADFWVIYLDQKASNKNAESISDVRINQSWSKNLWREVIESSRQREGPRKKVSMLIRSIRSFASLFPRVILSLCITLKNPNMFLSFNLGSKTCLQSLLSLSYLSSHSLIYELLCYISGQRAVHSLKKSHFSKLVRIIGGSKIQSNPPFNKSCKY